MLNAQVINIYRTIRTPHYNFYTGTGKVYQYQTPASEALKSAIYQEKVNRLWEANADTLVRLQVLPDDSADLDNLAGDCFNPKANPDVNPNTLKRQEEEFIEKINREGVYGIASEVKCLNCGKWSTVDSVWGFVGDNWKNSGYDLDVKAAALEKAGLWNQ